MAEAGADVLFLEMMIEIDRMLAVLDGAVASGLPIWLGFTCGDEHGDGATEDGVVRLRGGEPLSEAIAALQGMRIDVVNIMHTDVAVIGACLDALAECWDGPIGAYAHSGAYVNGEWVLGSELSPDEYLQYVEAWRAKGLHIVGGCCGIGPEHIELL